MRKPLRHSILLALLALALFAPLAAAAELPPPVIIERDGLRYGVVRPAGVHHRAPTMVVLATSLEDTFTTTYGGTALILHQRGWLIVSLDLPGHGKNRREGEKADDALGTWRQRIVAGEDVVDEFTQRLSRVVSMLIESGDTDPSRLVVGGISRGGFMALQAAAADSRFIAAAAFMPVTDLGVLQEFRGVEHDAQVERLGANHLASKLAGRPVWVTVGANDDRVGTVACLQFVEAVVSAAVQAGVSNRLEMHIVPGEGHVYPLKAETDAANWLERAANVRPPKT